MDAFDVSLPFTNPKEELESVSNMHLKPLFDIKKFEIRSETSRDKGIDFNIKIKRPRENATAVYTNFRFAIQLKATESITENKDGSFSLPLFSSNINYLLNNGVPAYYVLYHAPSQAFYW